MVIFNGHPDEIVGEGFRKILFAEEMTTVAAVRNSFCKARMMRME
jgi:hypothetical protein